MNQLLGAMKTALRCVLLALPLAATVLHAAPIDPQLAFAVTGGNWETGGRSGAYRVLVFTGGFEHVSSRVVAEWVADPTGNDTGPTVLSGHELVGAGFFSLGAPEVVRIEAGVRVTLSGVDAHSPEQEVSCVFELYPKGQVKVVKPCG